MLMTLIQWNNLTFIDFTSVWGGLKILPQTVMLVFVLPEMALINIKGSQPQTRNILHLIWILKPFLR